MSLLAELLSTSNKLLSEASKDDAPDLEDAPDPKDETDVKKDGADTVEDAPTEDAPVEEDPPTEDPPVDDTADTPIEDTPTEDAPVEEPTTVDSNVSDPQRRIYIFDRFEELTSEYESLEKFVNQFISNTDTNKDISKILKSTLNKIQLNFKYIKELIDDGNILVFDIPTLKKLFNIYFEDIKNIKDVIKIVNKMLVTRK